MNITHTEELLHALGQGAYFFTEDQNVMLHCLHEIFQSAIELTPYIDADSYAPSTMIKHVDKICLAGSTARDTAYPGHLLYHFTRDDMRALTNDLLSSKIIPPPMRIAIQAGMLLIDKVADTMDLDADFQLGRLPYVMQKAGLLAGHAQKPQAPRAAMRC